MKRKCKKVNITDINLILSAVYACLQPWKKRKRKDTISLFKTLNSDISLSKVKECLRDRNTRYEATCKTIANIIQACLLHNTLNLSTPKLTQRVDPGSGKIRVITVLNIWHLLLDHVAVKGLEELLPRIGITQVSSIKGRGARYGKEYIEKWLRNHKEIKYAVKMDIKDFYGSISQERLIQWLNRHVNNPRLVSLIKSLLGVIPKGMPIGSFLSQTLANLYLSDIWHYAKENLFYIRKSRHKSSKRCNLITQCLFYMDDMLFLGTNKKYLKKACPQIAEFAEKSLGLTIKQNWQIHGITSLHPVDIMGFRFIQSCTTLRKRIFRLARRSLLRACRKLYSLKFCRRLMSYKGYFKNLSTKTVLSRLNAIKSFQTASKLISYHAATC